MKNTNRLGEITESVITKNEIELRSGLQGISIMNNIPGVYLSQQSVNDLSTNVCVVLLQAFRGSPIPTMQ